MPNQVFALLKEHYDADGTILSSDVLRERLHDSCSSHDWVEGIYRFDAYLDACRLGERVE